MLLYFYASLFLCFYFSIHYHVYIYAIFPLSTWTFILLHFLFLLSIWTFSFVLKTLIINLNIKRLKALFGLWLLSLAFWSYGPLGLRIRTLDLGLWIPLCTAVTLPKFRPEVLGISSA